MCLRTILTATLRGSIPALKMRKPKWQRLSNLPMCWLVSEEAESETSMDFPLSGMSWWSHGPRWYVTSQGPVTAATPVVNHSHPNPKAALL